MIRLLVVVVVVGWPIYAASAREWIFEILGIKMSYSNATLEPFCDKRTPASQNHKICGSEGEQSIWKALTYLCSRVHTLYVIALVQKPFRLPQPRHWAGATPELPEGLYRRGCQMARSIRPTASAA